MLTSNPKLLSLNLYIESLKSSILVNLNKVFSKYYSETSTTEILIHNISDNNVI